MTAQEKITAKFNSMSHDELFEVMRTLNQKDDDASFILSEIATDVYMAKVPESTFCQAMDILFNEM